jgi:hypothetical protein
MITIQFELGDEPYVFRDALVLPEDHVLSDAEIEDMKQIRYKAWLELVQSGGD